MSAEWPSRIKNGGATERDVFIWTLLDFSSSISLLKGFGVFLSLFVSVNNLADYRLLGIKILSCMLIHVAAESIDQPYIYKMKKPIMPVLRYANCH